MTPYGACASAMLVMALACSAPAERPHRPRQLPDGLPAGSREAGLAIDEDFLAVTLRDLSSDRMEGRGPGSRGDVLARHSIAASLAAAGLAPGAADGTWEQEFDIVGITASLPAQWTFESDGETKSFRSLTEYVAASGVQQESATIEDAEVVFVGYGIRAPEHGWDDYKDVDLRGKVLLMMNNDPDWDPALFAGATRLYYGRWTYKYESAAAVGAAAAIIIHTTASAGYPWQVVQTSWTGEQFELPATGEPTVAVEGWLSEQAATELVAMAGFELDELRQVARTHTFEPVPLGIRTSLVLDSTIQRTRTANVVGVLQGRDPELAREAVVFTAHHDHLGIGTGDESEDVIYNGARDNATGVAMVLAIARAVGQLPDPPRRSLVFAFVGAEEQGLLGSQFYAAHPTFPPGRIAANVNIDGGNVLGMTGDIAYVGYGKSSLDDVIESIAAAQGRVVKGDEFPDRGYFYRSDQFSFAKIGVPALYIKPGTEYVGRPEGWGKQQVDLYTEHHYHQTSDEFDESWRFDGMAQDGRLALFCGLLVAETPALPKWNPGDEFESTRLRALEQLPR